MSEKAFEPKATLVMDHARSLGADQSAVRIVRAQDIEVVIRNDDLDLAQVSTNQSLQVRLYLGGRLGVFSTSDLRESALKEFVSRGVEFTRALSSDPHIGLPDPHRYPSLPAPKLDIYDSNVLNCRPEACISRAKSLINHAREIAQLEKLALINTTGRTGIEVKHELITASNGLLVTSQRTECYAGCGVAIQDTANEDKRRRGWWGVIGTNFKSLGDDKHDKHTALKAMERCARNLGATPGPTVAVPVIVENVAARKFVNAMIMALNGTALYRKNSYLADMKNKPVASSVLELQDDPLLPGALGSRWYDSEGVERQPMVVIQAGILKNYYLDTYHSRALNLSPTIGSSSNLVLKPNTNMGCEKLIETMDKGMVITQFLGGNFNSATGQFSYGIAGLWVENGKVVRPVEGMNVSGNYTELWNNLIKVGNDPYPYSRIRTPSLMFSKLSLSGNS